MKRLLIFAVLSFTYLAPAYSDWREHLTWCLKNTDTGASVECPIQFGAVGAAECVLFGGRACLMAKASGVASSGVPGACQSAYVMAATCQCHNSDNQDEILEAGVNQVCGFLGGPAGDASGLPHVE